MGSMANQVRVGVAAVIHDPQGRVIVGRRKGSTGANQWAFPGGHLEFGETYFECAERETLEETGLKVRATKMVTITNTVFQEVQRQYITIFVKCARHDPNQHPENLEPNKCDGWVWKTWSEIKDLSGRVDGSSEVFGPIVNLINENPDIEVLMGG